MNILFIHEIDWLRKVVFDVHMLSEALSTLGHNVYAIDYESMWDRQGVSDEEVDVSRAIPKSHVHLVRPKFIKISGLSRLSAFVSHYFAIKRVIIEKEIDAIVLYSVPTNGLQAVYLARKFNIPIIFRSIDILHQLVPYKLLRVITKRLEQIVYLYMDMILTLTPNLSNYVVSMGAQKGKVQVLPMTVDTNIFKPDVDTGDLRKTWNLNASDRVILFMGTLFEFSGLDKFVLEMPNIISQVPNAKLLIVGDGEQRRTLESIIAKLGLKDKIIITGFQPYQTMAQYINLADVCINSFIPNATTNDIFPGKTVQFLACGKPLVNTQLAGVKAMLSDQTQGIIYADSISQMADDVVMLLKSPDLSKMIGQNGIRCVRRIFDCVIVARQLEAILKQLVGDEA